MCSLERYFGVYFSRCFATREIYTKIKRAHKQSQFKPTRYYWLVIPGELEPFTFSVLLMKHDWSRTIKYYMELLCNMSSTRNTLHKINICKPFYKSHYISQSLFLCVRQRHSIIQLNMVKFKAAICLQTLCYHEVWWLYWWTRILTEIISKCWRYGRKINVHNYVLTPYTKLFMPRKCLSVVC